MVNMQLIKLIAKEKKMTIRQISKEVGITEQGLQSIIRNNTTTTDNLEKICKVLGVPVTSFFSTNDNIVKQVENIFSVKERPPDLDGHKRLSNDERIDILLSQNDRLITVLEKHSQTIGTNSNTINTLTNTINNLSYNIQGDTSKNVSGGAA